MHKNMYYKNLIIDIFAVTFRKEGVDWNKSGIMTAILSQVTFRKEGVDWNSVWIWRAISAYVTFRKEGVDWNSYIRKSSVPTTGHLPQGRCGLKLVSQNILPVLASHLPQGRCGLKYGDFTGKVVNRQSPSARKVWIEIIIAYLLFPNHTVTFRKEGVDWNHVRCQRQKSGNQSPSARKVWIEITVYSIHPIWYQGHLPQGRCGLKSDMISSKAALNVSPSARKVWIEMWIWANRINWFCVTFRKEGVDWNKVTCAIQQ